MIALEAFKARLVDGLLEVQKEEGEVARERFIFNRGATDEQLALLPAWAADDYQTFVRQHNGAKLFQHETLSYNDGFELFSIEDCLTYSEIWECPEKLLSDRCRTRRGVDRLRDESPGRKSDLEWGIS